VEYAQQPLGYFTYLLVHRGKSFPLAALVWKAK
jgi:hypothetical protein